jgi:hypothetical protein
MQIRDGKMSSNRQLMLQTYFVYRVSHNVKGLPLHKCYVRAYLKDFLSKQCLRQ